MDFEEFFRKKKIDLAALGKAEPALFSEFKTHFEQMGEKSFDHTKKYWFNKLRLVYHLAPEPKIEKVVIENRLAEQTIIETLSETTPPPAKTGFTPRFKPGVTKPTEPKPEPSAPENEKPAEPTTQPPAKVGFTPRFKAGVTKPVEPKEEPSTEPEKPAEATTPPSAKVGFTPRFKAGVTKPANSEQKEEPKIEPPAEDNPEESTEPKPAIGFKPRFKMKPKDGDE